MRDPRPSRIAEPQLGLAALRCPERPERIRTEPFSKSRFSVVRSYSQRLCIQYQGPQGALDDAWLSYLLKRSLIASRSNSALVLPSCKASEQNCSCATTLDERPEQLLS